MFETCDNTLICPLFTAHIDIVSVKETPYTMSTDSNEVPVSVVDMDVPVTAIDEVLEDYELNIAENEAKSFTRTESAGSKGKNKRNNKGWFFPWHFVPLIPLIYALFYSLMVSLQHG